MNFKDSKGNIDWWVVTGIIYIVYGIWPILISLGSDNLVGILLIGGVNAVVGMALIQKSKIVFHILRALYLLAASMMIIGIITGNTRVSFFQIGDVVETINSIMSLLSLISLAMLWKKLRAEKIVKW